MGECHYQDGNYKAQARGLAIQVALQEQGIDPDRFAIVWVSSAEAPRFAELVTDFVARIKKLGPNGHKRPAANTQTCQLASRES